jgi:hypothetical protein
MRCWRVLPSRRGGQHHGAHQLGEIHGRHARHEMPEGVPQDHRAPAALGTDHRGDVSSEVMQTYPIQGAAGSADTARLWPQNGQAAGGEQSRHLVDPCAFGRGKQPHLAAASL